MQYPLPELANTLAVLNADGTERSDVGRKVLINSVGGVIEDHDLHVLHDKLRQKVIGRGYAIVDEKGVVVRGPYRMVFKAKAKDRYDKKTKKWRYKDKQFTTEPYWLVRMTNGIYIHYVESEITFL